MCRHVDGTNCDHIIIKCTIIFSYKFCYFILVFVAQTNAECTFDIELLVDGNPSPSNKVLYKPVGSSGSFVRCQWCNDSYTDNPNWLGIQNCVDDKQKMICEDRVKNGIRDLTFLSFIQSQVGNYTCKGNGGTQSIMIAVLPLPDVTSHPTSQLTTVSMSVTLDCEGTGRGSITYHWETSNINGGQWMNIINSNSKTIVVSNLAQSQQYRCVVSNEAGSTRSKVATVTVLSEFAKNNV